MAAAIPLVIEFAAAAFAGGSVAAGAAGVAALATGSFGGFLTVAGGLMAGMGQLTGDENMKKIAGFMALGGGLAGAATAAAGAAGGEAASSAWGAAGSEAGSDAAQLGKYGFDQAADTAAASTTTAPLPDASKIAEAGMQPVEDGQTLYQRKLAEANQMPGDSSQITGGPLGTADATGMQALQTAAGPTGPAGPVDPLSYGNTNLSRLDQAGAKLDSSTLDGYLRSAWDKTGQVVNSIGKFTEANPNLTKFGLDMIKGAYGPEAEAMDFRKSIYNRRMTNLNNPVKLNRGT